ncbi:MAG: DUF1587 domain-containing protein [Planctomycetota bacterium]|jgi:hypothetical protein|nr:DUF1587 domain-containing protein [Planctomycetota bacterium]
MNSNSNFLLSSSSCLRAFVRAFFLFLLLTTLHAAPPSAKLPETHRALLQRYCFDCHDADTQKGKVNLEALPIEITTPRQAELWQKVLNAMNAGEMPPEKKEQPDNAAKANFLDDLAQTMVVARKTLSDAGGKITMRRLNRREYRNTIKHLTGLSIDVESLPADGGGGTFDTTGSSLFISSDQFEQYLKLGRRAMDEMFARRVSQQQQTRSFRVEPEKTINVENLKSIKEMEEKVELLKPWMAAVDKAVKAPENAAVMKQLRQEYPDIDKHPYRIYRVSKRLKGVPDLEQFSGDPDTAMNFYQLSYHRSYESLKHYAKLPHNVRGTYLRQAAGVVRLDIGPPAEERDLQPGKYRLRFRAGIVEGSPPERHFIEVGHPQRVNQVPAGFDNHPLSSHQVTGTIDNPQVIETIVEIPTDTPKEFGIQERQPKDFGARIRKHYADQRKNGHGTPPALWVDWIELEGPISEDAVTKSKTWRVEPENTINPANEKEIAQIEERQERFERWRKGVDEAAKTPENQAIISEIRKTDRLIDHPNRFYTFADRLKDTPNPRDFGFVDSAKAAAADPSRSRSLALHKHYASLPHSDRGTYLKLAHGTGRVIVAPKELPPGNYVMRVHVGVVKDTPASRRFIQVGHPQRQIASRNWDSLAGPSARIRSPAASRTRKRSRSRSPSDPIRRGNSRSRRNSPTPAI